MAITSLHNGSVLDSSFLRESESLRRNGDVRRPSTRASSLLQMWRELEDEHVVSRVQDGYGEMLGDRRNDRLVTNILCTDTHKSHGIEQMGVSEDRCTNRGTDHENEVQNNSMCDRSDDFGEVERERGNSQEWVNCHRGVRASNVPQMNNHSRAEWLVETEQENMRIIRGSAQMNSEQRAACRENKEEQTTEMGGPMVQVLGLVVNQNRDWTEHIRRGNRRLCGRQVLLDMLSKAVLERRKELQSLMMHRAVSMFAHRNRIQSLLRGRFLRNDRIIEDKRPSSLAVSELGLLRQRHTVSGLREGFISRVEHSGSSQVSRSYSDISSNSDSSDDANEQTEEQGSDVVMDAFHELSLPNNQKGDGFGLRDGTNDFKGNNDEDISWREPSTHMEEWKEQDSDHGARDWQPSSSVEFVEGSDVLSLNMDKNRQITSTIVWSEETMQNQEGEHRDLPEGGPVLYEEAGPTDWLSSASVINVERSDPTLQHGHLRLQEACKVLCGQSEPISDATSTANVSSDHADIVEGNTNEDMNWQEFAAEVEEQEDQVQDNEDIIWQGASIEYNEWINVGGDTFGNQQERYGNEWSQELSTSENIEEGYVQESPQEWHEDGSFQEAVHNWLEEPSDHQGHPVGRIDMFDLPDEDSANGAELRELQSRRRVSSLLHSGFRARLDHLIQSYAERQSRASVDWELHGTLPSPLGEQDLEHQSRDQNHSEGVAVGSPSLDLPSSPMLPVQSIWDTESHNDNWQQLGMHQRLGIDWEIINDMRIDMAMLHQRMNNMQRTLEACMDMQLELQRSIRQEVSAALNRPASTPGVCTDAFPEDGSKWDYVRKGICCVCCNNNINSLLYRCGHTCACSECADGLVQSRGKCPMCLAPVVEAVRVYSIS